VNGALDVLAQYGYAILFGFVLLEQVGLPIPAVPILLGVGALAADGRMSLGLALVAVLAASLPPDFVWHALGARRGARVLRVLCRISLEPDSCVRRTENLFVRHGRLALVFVKFLPGLSPIASTLSGMIAVPRWQFAALDGLGAVVWAGAWMTLGWIFSDALEAVAAGASRAGRHGLALAGLALACYVAAKYVKRRRVFLALRTARITPDELRRRLTARDPDLAIVDTRSALDVQLVPYAIAGATWIPAEEIDRRAPELPVDREIVLYCS
jgi:membrane protein DedA with SNARE-associated domain